jgi:hypothetical protein
MRTIQRKEVEFLSATGQRVKLDNFTLVRSIIETPPPEGFTIAQIEARVSILRSLKHANGMLVIDDEQHQMLLSSLVNHRFGMATEELLELVNSIRSAPLSPERAPA